MIERENLKPHVHILKLTGGTGDGKTQIATVFSSPEARKILLRGVGRTNSTLRERLMVYTNAQEDRITVASKLNEDILDRGLFIDILSNSLAKVVRSNGKAAINSEEKNEKELVKLLEEELNGKNNVRAVLTFLSDQQKKDFIESIVGVYRDFEFSKHNYVIYNTVRNSLPESEIKDNSAKLLRALKTEVENVLDLESANFKEKLWEIWKHTNELLKNIFFLYFNKEDISNDKYYYKNIYLDNPDEQFIEAMFTSNNLQNGERLSLEVLCNEIIIYTPLNKDVAEIIKQNQIASKVFTDSRDNIAFGVYDTRGLYHADNQESENIDYLSDLLYHGDADALVMVVPLYGDSNEKKIYELYKNAFTNYKKQIPVYMINNKVDLFIDSLNKDQFDDDPLSLSMEGDTELSFEEIEEKISDRVNELSMELRNGQNKARSNMNIVTIPCYLKRDKNMQKEVVEKYNVRCAIQTILHGVAKYLQETAIKIPFRLSDASNVEIGVSIDRKRLKSFINEQVSQESTTKKVFVPGMLNLSSNIGKTPHGNGYNALKRRLKFGDGYTSNIDENYYYSCQSFSIDFTANLRNFVTQDFLNKIIYETIQLEGGAFIEQDGEMKFRELIEKNINPKSFVSKLLYEDALMNAESQAFSFKSKFNQFLNNCIPYLNGSQIDEERFTSAFESVVKEAGQKTIAMNIIFK